MSRIKKKYTAEFKLKAVELSFARGSVKQISEELNVPLSVLSRWRREHKEYGKNSFPGKGNPKMTDEQKELAELKKHLKDIELENAILKKVVSIFSTSDKKNIGL